MLNIIYNNILLLWAAIGFITFFILLKVAAPYGKFSNSSWGAMIPYKFGWIIQEIISPITFSYFFLTGTIDEKSLSWFFFILWNLHYLNRSIIFPFKQKKQTPYCPIIIVLFAISFNIINGFLNGYYLGNVRHYELDYILNINFSIGFVIFIAGFLINYISDNILIKIKKENDCYKIPKGSLYQYISCPNYLGEIIEWFGFFIMTLSIPALLFLFWTIANLVPRAISTHKWYKHQFQNYPKNRKAIIPFII